MARDERRLKGRLKKAGIRQTGRLEELDGATARGLDRQTLEFLSRGTWLKDKRNVALTGPCGAGKTFIASALTHRACDLGFNARYCRLPRLLQELQVARADGTYAKELASLEKVDLLVLDDRYQKKSTLVAAQLPLENWHAWIGDPALADAILDRLVHNAYRLELKGESQRKMRGIPEGELR